MKILLFIIAAAILHVSAFSQIDRRQVYNVSGNHVAIQGYDPVSYFTQGNPAEGKKSVTATYRGISYYFANEKNKETFLADPAKYEPQYGGWCAYAMGAKGEKVGVDPETFKVVNGKLYLFYNKFFNNTLTLWNKDEKNLHSKADANWAKLYRD